MNHDFRPLSLDVGTPESPLDFDVLKSHLAVDSENLDSLLRLYESAALTWAESNMKRSILSRRHTWVLSKFPCGYQSIRLPRGLTQEVESISYYSNGELFVMHGPSSGSPGNDYQEALLPDGAVLMPLRGRSWPSTDCDVPAPVTIVFHAGWLTAADVPNEIKYAMMFACSDMLEIRGPTDLVSLAAAASSGRTTDVRENLLGGYRLERFY